MNYPIGIQLYSVRDSMQEDFEGTLRKIAELGYKSVEFAGFFGTTESCPRGNADEYRIKGSPDKRGPGWFAGIPGAEWGIR